MSTKHTVGPWVNRDGQILADTREFTCCGNQSIGAVYMGDVESVCCGTPDIDGDSEEVIATVQYERDIPLVCAAPDLLAALIAMVEIAELTVGWLPTPPDADGPLIQGRAAIKKALGESA